MSGAVAEPPVAAAGVRASPYVGLQPYGEDDAVFFFGREAERKILSANLGASRMTVLYAESGVGKSSVLRAGVASHLRRMAEQNAVERGGPRILPVVFADWRDDPAEGLMRAIREAAAQFSDGADLPGERLDEVIAAVNERLEARPMIILDQFEEYFRYHAATEDEPFAEQFVTAVNRPDLRAGVLVAIREDALARLDLFQGRIPDMLANYVRMDHLDVDAARAAIAAPLVVYDSILEEHGDPRRGSVPSGAEPELVERVLSEVSTGGGDRDGARASDGGRIETPHLQLVLRRLWDEECGAGSTELRLETLERIGGAQRIIETHLDETMETLTPHERDLAAYLFRQFVTPSGTKYAHTISDLVDLTDQPAEDVGAVLDKLARPGSQILRAVAPAPGKTDGYRYEITHDVLGTAILDWRRRHEGEEKDRRIAEAEQEAREANEKHLKERRRARLFRGLMIASLILLVLSIAAGVSALVARSQANAEAKRSASRSAAWKASDFIGRNYRTNAALLAAVEALWLEKNSFEARRAVLSGLHENPSLGGILEGYSPRLSSVAFSPGSGLIATGSADGTVRLSSARSHAPIATLNQQLRSFDRRASLGKVVDLVFAGPHTLVAGATNSGGDLGGVVAWDIASLASPRPLERYANNLTGSAKSVLALAYAPDVSVLAVGRKNRPVVLRDLTDPERPTLTKLLSPAVPDLGDLAISPDGTTVAATGKKGLSVWHRDEPVISRNGDYSALAFSPDGTRLAVGTRGGDIEILNPLRPEGTIRTFVGHLGAVVGLAFNSDGSLLVSGGADNAVLLWDFESGRPLGGPRTNKSTITAVAFAPDGRFALVGSDGTVRLWRAGDRSLATTLGSAASGNSYSLALLPGGLVATAGYNSFEGDLRVPLWRAEDPARSRPGTHPIKPKYLPDDESAYVVAGAEDLVAVERFDDTTIWRMSAGLPPKLLGSVPGNVSDIAISQDATRLAAANFYGDEGSSPGLVKLWDLAQLSPKEPLKSPLDSKRVQKGFIDDLVFSPDGKLLATAGDDGSLAILDVSRDKLEVRGGVRRNAHNGQTVTSLAFAPDSKVLASGGLDQRIVLWDLTNPARLVESVQPKRFPPQPNSLLALAFSHDGTILASGDADGDVTLWDVDQREALGSPLATSPNANPGDDESVYGLAFEPDDRFLLAGGRNVPVVVWGSDLWSRDFETLRRDVCQVVRRDLTTTEWADFFDDTPFEDKWRPTCSEGGKR